MSNIATTLSLAAMSLYAIAAGWQTRLLMVGQGQQGRLVVSLAAIGCGLHALVVVSTMSLQTATLTLPEVSSLIFLSLTGLLLVALVKKPWVNLLIFVLPLSAISIAMMLSMKPIPLTHLPYTTPQLWHIGLSIVAFSVLIAAGLQAVLLAIGEYMIKAKRSHQSMASLPPLQTMERSLFQMVAVGFALLSAVLVTSLFTFDGIWSGNVFEKTLLATLAWCVFLGLLLGRYFYGWRGRVAINGTLFGMAILMLSYFGTRLLIQTA